MPRVSIITPAFFPSSAFLAETIAGVAAQDVPSGWDVEWIVQEDGDSPSLAHHFSGISYVRYDANGAHLGIAATRNLALGRATGTLIRVLDSDDVLLPNALASLVRHFDDPSIHWAVGQADDLHSDGRRVAWDSALPYGVISAGLVNSRAEADGGNWPVHCAGLMARTASVRALGGWAGLPNDEDLVMFAALSEITVGDNDQAVSWLYRQHPNQATRTPSWRARSDASRQSALLRARAVRATGLRFDPHRPPVSAGESVQDVPVAPAAKYSAL